MGRGFPRSSERAPGAKLREPLHKIIASPIKTALDQMTGPRET
jgi:hypothetical protein